jgi:hypothetical protein
MAKDVFWTVTTFVIIIGVLSLTFWPQDKNQVVVKYDCRQLAGGWYPDVPVAVHEECKKRGVTK